MWLQEAGAARVGEELAAEADQAARRDAELEADAAGAVVRHVRHAALAAAEPCVDDADVVLGHVDDERAPSARGACRRSRCVMTSGLLTESS